MTITATVAIKAILNSTTRTTTAATTITTISTMTVKTIANSLAQLELIIVVIAVVKNSFYIPKRGQHKEIQLQWQCMAWGFLYCSLNLNMKKQM